MAIPIGIKIRNFRQSRGLSQTELEIGIDASSGSISRMESGSTNPTKETIWAIADFLQLEVRELDYILGKQDIPVTQEEVLKVKQKVKDLFSKPGFLGYILDDRYRMVYVSDTFYKILNQKPENIEGKSIVDITLDPKYGVRDSLDPEHFEDTVKTVVERFYADMYFMMDDPYVKEDLTIIKNDPIARKFLPEKFSYKDIRWFHTQEERKAYFKLFGIKFALSYSSYQLYGHTRFAMVEYYKDSLLFKMMSRFI